MTPENPDYPATLEIDFPQKPSRLLIFVRGILVIPHYIALLVLGIGAFFVWIISFWAILFTGRYPEGMFNYMVGLMRWGTRVIAYQFFMTDKYPPFSLEDDPSYPVRIQIAYPPQVARWRPLVNWLLAYPALIASYGLMLLAYVCVFFAFFAILFTGRYPQGLFNAVSIGLRWQLRVNSFSYWMTEKYPPFVWA